MSLPPKRSKRCEWLGWHKPTDHIWFDGLSARSVCVRCFRSIMKDSQGNWFPV